MVKKETKAVKEKVAKGKVAKSKAKTAKPVDRKPEIVHEKGEKKRIHRHTAIGYQKILLRED